MAIICSLPLPMLLEISGIPKVSAAVVVVVVATGLLLGLLAVLALLVYLKLRV